MNRIGHVCHFSRVLFDCCMYQDIDTVPLSSNIRNSFLQAYVYAGRTTRWALVACSNPGGYLQLSACPAFVGSLA
jgi:hypothetical protein